MNRFFILILGLLVVLPAPVSAQVDLIKMNLQQLMNIDVSTVSKRPERLFEAAAAIHVITGEDIRRSGVRSIPEALRLAPGVNVARIDANKWAVTARGFNSRAADKLLVLIDGRSVYTPSSSGVFWDVQHYLLKDIDRIEVIRGSGSALWGANAVNGVINIITKDAFSTEDSYVTVGAGTEELGFGDVRIGYRISEHGSVRAYFDYVNRDDLDGGFDAWWRAQGGARTDWHWGEHHLTVQGDYYGGLTRQRQVVPSLTAPHLPVINERFDVAGGNVLARYERQYDAETSVQLQVYYDRTKRDDLVFGGTRDTIDFDFQHRFPILPQNDFIYGLGLRYFHDEFFNDKPEFVIWDPAKSNHFLYSGFLQNELSLFDDRLRLTLGTKIEYNDFTHWEFQPNVRLTWLPAPRHVVWAAVSRAVQTPARNANDIRILLPVPPITPPGSPLPIFFVGLGDDSIGSLELISYELGYRVQPTDTLLFDVAAFYNDYDNLVTGEVGQPVLGDPPTHLLIPSISVNGGGGKSYGVEISAEWRPFDIWRLVGSYSYLKIDLKSSLTSLFVEGQDPRHQASLRSSLDLPWNLDLDVWGRFVDNLPTFAALDVDAYVDLDIRLGWQPLTGFEVAVVGQNLLGATRAEFGSQQFNRTLPSRVQRGFYAQISYEF